MMTVPELAADALGSFLTADMKRAFGSSHARLTELVPSVARLALECIGNSDALYHNVQHGVLDIVIERVAVADAFQRQPRHGRNELGEPGVRRSQSGRSEEGRVGKEGRSRWAADH